MVDAWKDRDEGSKGSKLISEAAAKDAAGAGIPVPVQWDRDGN